MITWIIEFSNYKVFLRELIKTFPGHGRGQAARLAEHLNVTPMVISHILKRERHFTQSQALSAAKFFGLDEQVTEYFLLMVDLAKADAPELRDHFQEKINRIREEQKNLKNFVPGKTELSEHDMGIYYSNWYYGAVWLLTAIKGYQNIDSISEYFKMSRAQAGEILAFLLKTGLSVQEDGFIKPGKTSIHVPRNSPFVNNHRRNWREKAREKFDQADPDDIFYSSPVSISKKDAEEFGKELRKMVNAFSKRVEGSPEQQLVCLNIDYFRF